MIASEDAGFAEHSGVDWDAIEKAWERNQRAEARAERLNAAGAPRAEAPAGRPAPARRRRAQPRSSAARRSRSNWPRTCSSAASAASLRKGQEFVITLMLEALLSKQRILEIYLNNVEWGEGLFGAQAAARHYFRVDADRSAPMQAARLAVMLPAPKRFEKRPGSAYVIGRAGTDRGAHGRGRAAVSRRLRAGCLECRDDRRR